MQLREEEEKKSISQTGEGEKRKREIGDLKALITRLCVCNIRHIIFAVAVVVTWMISMSNNTHF